MPLRRTSSVVSGQRVARVGEPLARAAKHPLAGLFGLRQVAALYETAEGQAASEVAAGMLARLRTRAVTSPGSMASIPAEGPVVVVANHPFGGVEGIIMGSLLTKARPDTRILANYLLGSFPRLRDLFILVNPFEGAQARRENVKGLKEALAWLHQDGVLAVFPAGEVAHYQLQTRHVTDSRWNPNVAALARKSGAAMLPMHFVGGNGPLFHLCGMIHPKLRTALLARELANKTDRACVVHIGHAVPAAELARFDDEQAIEYMRLRAYALAGREMPEVSRRRRPKRKVRIGRKPHLGDAIGPPVDRALMERDIAALPPDALLAEAGGLRVYQADAEAVPHILPELGRLREVTFRAVGEGTGKPLDLDQFDRSYRHLLLWHEAKGELVGSYRLGLMDRLLAAKGRKGLYIATLFDFGEEFLERLGSALELGRSFIRPEYQHRPSPLMLLWQGIAQYVVRNPRYRYMIGPVSISNRYRPASRALMMKYLTQPQFLSPLARLLRPRQPLDPRRGAPADLLERVHLIRDLGDLSAIVSDIETDGKGVPPLLRQYLKFGARVLAFNIDPDFGHCLDCLCLFDAATFDDRNARRFVDNGAAERFRAHHGVQGGQHG
jgi:putative hemolysin